MLQKTKSRLNLHLTILPWKIKRERKRMNPVEDDTYLLALVHSKRHTRDVISPSLATRALVIDVFPNADDHKNQEQQRKSKQIRNPDGPR